MRIYKSKLYQVDYQGTHGGGVDHFRGSVILKDFPWIIDGALIGNVILTKVC